MHQNQLNFARYQLKSSNSLWFTSLSYDINCLIILSLLVFYFNLLNLKIKILINFVLYSKIILLNVFQIPSKSRKWAGTRFGKTSQPMPCGKALRTVAGIILYTAFMHKWQTRQTRRRKPITVAVLLVPLPATIFLQPNFIQKKARHKDWPCSAISSTGSLEKFSLPFFSPSVFF